MFMFFIYTIQIKRGGGQVGFVGNNELTQFKCGVGRVEGCIHVGFKYMYIRGRDRPDMW